LNKKLLLIIPLIICYGVGFTDGKINESRDWKAHGEKIIDCNIEKSEYKHDYNDCVKSFVPCEVCEKCVYDDPDVVTFNAWIHSGENSCPQRLPIYIDDRYKIVFFDYEVNESVCYLTFEILDLEW
jgi:hypothetical protein